MSTTIDARHRPQTRTAVRFLVLLALVVGVMFGMRWWSQPHLFGNLGDAYESDPRPVADAALSTAVTYPKTAGGVEVLTLTGAKAVFADNTAKAEVSFSICHMGEQEDVIGAVEDPQAYCADLEPFEAGSSFRHGTAPDTDYLIVTLTPTEPGVTDLTLVELSYRRGASHLFQQGTETIAVQRTINVT